MKIYLTSFEAPPNINFSVIISPVWSFWISYNLFAIFSFNSLSTCMSRNRLLMTTWYLSGLIPLENLAWTCWFKAETPLVVYSSKIFSFEIWFKDSINSFLSLLSCSATLMTFSANSSISLFDGAERHPHIAIIATKKNKYPFIYYYYFSFWILCKAH